MATQTRHSKTYEELAKAAARQTGLRTATVAAVAENPAAREIRDGLWLDYESRLRDDRTYTCKQVAEWLRGVGVKGAISSVHRDRTAVLAGERSIRLRAQLAKAVLDAAGDGGEADVFRGGRVLAGQMIFESLNALPVGSLNTLADEPGKLLAMIEVLGRLSRDHAQVDLAQARLAEMRRSFDEQITVEKAKAKGSKDAFDAAAIDRIRKAIFGEAA